MTATLKELMVERDRLEAITATRMDGSKLHGAEAKSYLQGVLSANSDPDKLMTTDTEAPLGCLRWLNDDSEVFPLAGQVNYSISYDEYGSVYPTLAMRNAEGEVIGGVQFSADGLLELGQWAMQMAFSKLELQGMGVGAVTGRGVLLEQVDTLINSLVRMAPETLTGRVAETTKATIAKEVERGIQARLEAENVLKLNAMERRHAAEVMELAKIAARRDEESREEALGSPIVEKMIVRAKEMLDADSVSSTLAAITRQG